MAAVGKLHRVAGLGYHDALISKVAALEAAVGNVREAAVWEVTLWVVQECEEHIYNVEGYCENGVCGVAPRWHFIGSLILAYSQLCTSPYYVLALLVSESDPLSVEKTWGSWV